MPMKLRILPAMGAGADRWSQEVSLVRWDNWRRKSVEAIHGRGSVTAMSASCYISERYISGGALQSAK